MGICRQFVVAILVFASTRAATANLPGKAGFLAPTEAEQSLRELASIYGGFLGTDGRAFRRLAAIERSVNATFAALPKNADGRLGAKGLRHIVQSYFSKEHGWLLKGLDQRHLLNVTNVHEAVIFQDMVPEVERSLIRSLHAKTGSSLGDCVALLAVFEHLISQENMRALEAAYKRNNFVATDILGLNGVDIVLQTYLWALHEDGAPSQEEWAKFLRLAPKYDPSFAAIMEFESDAVRNFFYDARDATNPFFLSLPFEAVATVLEGLVRDYGKWQQSDCRTIKNALTIVDPEVTGRVPLGTFYAQPQAPTHMFVETADDLRTMGALEETSDGAYVRIVNYLLGPSNCIAHSDYYCVCCLSECEKITEEIDEEIQAPTAEPQRLLWLVSNITSESILEPRNFSKDMADKLYAIAARNGGDVPLHGRMFAQWLHYAFPHECPYPHVAEKDVKTLDPAMWLGGAAPVVGELEKDVYTSAVHENVTYAVLEAQSSQWSDEEVLPFAEEPSVFRHVFRISAMVVLGFALLRLILGLLRGSCGAACRLLTEKDDEKELEWSRTL